MRVQARVVGQQVYEAVPRLRSPAPARRLRYVLSPSPVGVSPICDACLGVANEVTSHNRLRLLITEEPPEDGPQLPTRDCSDEFGGRWHPYRRKWATERKHLPDVDVARAGGWKDLKALKESYQQDDPSTTLEVLENRKALREVQA